jgi:hypothetical protein
VPSLVKSLSAQWDLWLKRYKAFIVTDEEDIQACANVLEEVRRKELNRVAGESVLDSHAFSGEAVDYRLAACRDTRTNEIIGCMRLTKAQDAKSIPSSRDEYHLDLLEDELLKDMIIFTRLAILRPYRKTPAALVLMCFCFADTLEEGGQGVLMSCEPNLFPMYKRLGLRPIGPLHNSPSGGYRIPMICIPDLDYLKAIRSPCIPLLKSVDFTQYYGVRQWYRDVIVARKGMTLF